MLAAACGLIGIGCGSAAAPPEYALRFDVTYPTDFEQQGVELHWGSARSRGGSGSDTIRTVGLERGFATRDEALALPDPARVLIGGAMIHSELLTFSACDVVAAHGLDASAVRLARFFRRMDDAGQTVSPLPAMYFSVPLVCYTSTRLDSGCDAPARDRQELFYALHVPMGRVSFTLDDEPLVPYGLGFDGFSTEMIVHLRISRPVGASGDSLGRLVATVDGVVGTPFDVGVHPACKQETNAGALLRQSLYLKWDQELGQLGFDDTTGYSCSYQNGVCRGGAPLPN